MFELIIAVEVKKSVHIIRFLHASRDYKSILKEEI